MLTDTEDVSENSEAFVCSTQKTSDKGTLYIVMHIIVRYYFCRLCTGHGKPGKSWNFLFQFPGLKSHRSEVKVMETHSKTSAQVAKSYFKN